MRAMTSGSMFRRHGEFTEGKRRTFHPRVPGEQTSWLLFLKYLDGLEQDKATEAALDGKKYSYILDKPYRLVQGPLGRTTE